MLLLLQWVEVKACARAWSLWSKVAMAIPGPDTSKQYNGSFSFSNKDFDAIMRAHRDLDDPYLFFSFNWISCYFSIEKKEFSDKGRRRVLLRCFIDYGKNEEIVEWQSVRNSCFMNETLYTEGDKEKEDAKYLDVNTITALSRWSLWKACQILYVYMYGFFLYFTHHHWRFVVRESALAWRRWNLWIVLIDLLFVNKL